MEHAFSNLKMAGRVLVKPNELHVREAARSSTVFGHFLPNLKENGEYFSLFMPSHQSLKTELPFKAFISSCSLYTS